MKLTPEQLAALAKIKAYKRPGEIHATVEITDEAFRALIADLEEAQHMLTESESDNARHLAEVIRGIAELRKQLAEATAARGNGVLVPAPKLEEMQAELRALRQQLAEAQEQLASPYMDGYEAAKEEYRPQVIAAEAELASVRKQLAEAQAKLAHLAEYWNRDENEIAMKDACWHTVEVAEASNTSALDAAIAEAVEPYRKDAERYQIVRAAMFDEHLMGLICMHDEELETPDEFDRVVSAAIAAKGGKI